MRITGKGIWGPPADKAAALATLRRAVELGVQFIDTADSYGPNVSEELIAEALYPYPSGLVIATKAGWERSGPGQWLHNASPSHLTEAVEGSLKRLRLDRIDVFQLHVPDPAVSYDATMETLATLRQQGKIRHVGLSNVTQEHIERGHKIVPIVSVQNRYGVADREWDYVVDYCEQNGIAFLPWAPLGQNRKALDVLEKVAKELGATTLQTALAWLLKRSKIILPIPGTSSAAHVEENVAAAGLELPEAAFQELSSANPPPVSYRVSGSLSSHEDLSHCHRARRWNRQRSCSCRAAGDGGTGRRFVSLSNSRTSHWGGDYFRQHGVMMPENGLTALRGKDAILFGSAGDPHIPDHITLWGLRLKICQGLDQYANVRPTRILPGIDAPLKRCRAEDLNWVIVRENTEGEYSGVGGRVHQGHPIEVATDLSLMTRAGVERIHRFAFKLAQSRPRKLLTVITKSNAQRHAMVMWDEIAAQIAEEFPDVTWDKELVDAATARMVNRPSSLDTIVATNLHADILSDLAAALAGSLGIAPTANINPERLYPSMFEPIHGSAFDIMGKGWANPVGTFWSVVMLLEHLGEMDAAARVMRADRTRHGESFAAHARSRRHRHYRPSDRGRLRSDCRQTPDHGLIQ